MNLRLNMRLGLLNILCFIKCVHKILFSWKVTGLRVFAHINVLWLLGSSVYAVVLVVERSTQPEAEHGWWRRNESTIIVSLITAVFPAIFEGLGIIEQYHPRKKLRMQLARYHHLYLKNIWNGCQWSDFLLYVTNFLSVICSYDSTN